MVLSLLWNCLYPEKVATNFSSSALAFQHFVMTVSNTTCR